MNLLLLKWARLICVTAVVQLPVVIAQSPVSLGENELVNKEGLRLSLSETDTDPALTIVLPGAPSSEPEMRVLFPEHVTAKTKEETHAEHLYLFRPGMQGEKPRWKRSRDSFEYEWDF